MTINTPDTLDTPDALDILFEQLKHPNPHLRDEAMWEIAEYKDEVTIDRLMSVLDDENTDYRRAAVKVLGAIGLNVVPVVTEAMLNSPNVTVRGSCAKALAQVALNYPEELFPAVGLQGLKTAIDDDNPVVHIAAVMALGVMGAPAFEILTESLRTTENIAVQVAIVNALGSLKDPRGLEVLNAIGTNEAMDVYVKESAISAVSRLEQALNFSRSRT
jgi:bilin biosynthesis protein